jgi:hypothetical protein
MQSIDSDQSKNKQLTQGIKAHLATLTLSAALLGFGAAAQAAVMEYQLMPGSQYDRNQLDAATQLPVASSSVGIGGTIKIDTGTGALISAQFSLGSYTELYDFAPLAPFTDYAFVDHDNETQSIVAVIGNVVGTVISFSGANAWSAAVGGSVSCSAAGGVQGNNICATAAALPWGPLAIDLLFTPDLSALMASSNWGDSSGGTLNNNSLNMFAVRVNTVPVPAAFWLMGSGLGGLLALQRRRKVGRCV